MRITVPHGDRKIRYLLKDVLYAPDMTATLVSLGRFDDAGDMRVNCYTHDSARLTPTGPRKLSRPGKYS